MHADISCEGCTLGQLRNALERFSDFQDEDHVEIGLLLDGEKNPATLVLYITAADGSGFDDEVHIQIGEHFVCNT